MHKNQINSKVSSKKQNYDNLEFTDLHYKNRKEETNEISKTCKINNATNNHDELNLELQRENRISQVISLFSKGLTQSEIAEKMEVNQSTVSRDLQLLQQEAKKKIWKYLNEDILFEYLRYIVGNNEISKKLWEIVQNENTSTKDKTNALSLLNQSYIKRLEILMTGVESFKDVKKSVSEIEDIEMMDRNPMLKLSSKLGKLPNPFSKK